MTSGRKLTEQQADAILRLVGQIADDGRWAYSLSDIARQLDLHRTTVYAVVRHAAARWGEHTRWKSDDFALDKPTTD